MENANVEARVKEVVVEQLGVDPAEVVAKANLFNDLGMDSLDNVELVMSIEEEFGIEIDDEAAAKFVTVNDITEHVKTALAAVK